MCTGLESIGGLGTALSVGGTVMGGLSSMQYGQAQADMARADAAGEMDAAQAHAQKIRRTTRREVGAARAAIAGSGTALDEFSLINTGDIEQRGEEDALMTVLSGTRRARALRTQAGMSEAAGRNALFGSLLTAGGQAYSGWKGAQAKERDPLRPLLRELGEAD